MSSVYILLTLKGEIYGIYADERDAEEEQQRLAREEIDGPELFVEEFEVL